MNDIIANTPHTSNVSTELAKERNHAAYDRTLMAWIRTSLSLIGFGIGIFEFSQKTSGETIFRSSKMVGLLFMLLGIIAVILAIRENKLVQRQLLNPEIQIQPGIIAGNCSWLYTGGHRHFCGLPHYFSIHKAGDMNHQVKKKQ